MKDVARRASLTLTLLAASAVFGPPSVPAEARGATAIAATSPMLALAQLDRKLADLDAEEASAKTEISTLGTRIAAAHGRVVNQGKAFYRLTRAGLLPVGGGFEQLVRHAMRVERARRILANEVASEKQTREHGADLARKLEALGKERASLATERAQLEAARVAAEDELRRQSAFDRAFETSARPSGGANDFVAVYGGAGGITELGGSPATTSTFSSQKGRLMFPLAGRAEIKSARREGASGPGLELKAPLGSAVRAVAAGRVAFADRFGPYGRIVIVDHGEHYYTVSGNLASIDVKVGDEISGGQRLGAIGDEGQGPMLYFEVRRGSETIRPEPWLGL
ncbi:MAG: peptidoglycan DD-metalloendopeptidase family protein [Polyangiaceae bacterium]